MPVLDAESFDKWELEVKRMEKIPSPLIPTPKLKNVEAMILAKLYKRKCQNPNP